MTAFDRTRWDNLSVVTRVLVPTVGLGLAVSGVAYALDLPSWAGPPAVVLIMTAAAWVGLHRRVRGPLRVANAWVERRVDGDVNARLPVTSGDEAESWRRRSTT